MLIRLILILTISLMSCYSNGSKKNIENIKDKDSCSESAFELFIANNSSSNISLKFKKLMHGKDDSCTLVFFQIVVNNYLSKRDTKSFQDLNQISCAFDGYISEAFVDYMPKFVESKNTIFFEQLFSENKKETVICLEEFTLHYIQVYDTDSAFKSSIRDIMEKSKNKDFKEYLSKFK